MLFNSYIFIFVFLPLTLGSYYGLHKLGKPVFAKVALILMSFWFIIFTRKKLKVTANGVNSNPRKEDAI